MILDDKLLKGLALTDCLQDGCVGAFFDFNLLKIHTSPIPELTL